MHDYQSRDFIEAIDHVATALHRLGNADATTPFGALEAHGLAMKEAADIVAVGLEAIAEAIDNHAKELSDGRNPPHKD